MSMHYFDNASTTKVDPRVLETMLPYFNEFYENIFIVNNLTP